MVKHYKTRFTTVLLWYALFGFTFLCHSQQVAQYTQYMYNTLAINPAYTGSREVISILGAHRSQWVGLDGAPASQVFSIHAPVKRRVGLGLAIQNDEIGNGTMQWLNADAMFSYTILLENEVKLAFGLSAGLGNLNVNFAKLRIFDPQANVGLVTNIDNRFLPRLGAGIYLRAPKYYFGVSTPNVVEQNFFENSANPQNFRAREVTNIYFIGGYVLDIATDIKFKPAFLAQLVAGAPVKVDISGNMLYKETVVLGAAYRYKSAISALVGYQISEKFFAGLAYDREIAKLGNTVFNNGSFEILLRYEFEDRNCKCTPKRRFY